MPTTMLFVVDATVLILSVIWLRLWRRSRRRNPHGCPLPPGPKGIPIIGNVFDMPKSDEALAILNWGKKYGDMIYVEIMGKPMLFLNSYNDAVELLEKRSLWYSDRPTWPMSGELLDWEWSPVITHYDERFKTYRQFMHRHFKADVCHDYWVTQTEAARIFAQQMLEKPNECERHARRYAAAATIMMAAYGHEVAPEGDYFVALADRAVEAWSRAAAPGAYLVDTLPWLKHIPSWFPGAKFKRDAKIWSQYSKEMRTVPYEKTMKKIVDGTAHPSMMSGLIEFCTQPDGTIRDEDIISACTCVCYGAGADTTVALMMSFILALLMYPDVQTRGQEELDCVVGNGRLPTFDDRGNLPYIEGIVKEALRWNPVLPLTIPHRLMKDDFYNGYFIPEGTQVIANHWAMLHDEVEYPDPSRFWPERWMPGGCSENSRHPSKVAFGFGRRICPGQYFATNSLFIGIATVLATVNITAALDENGIPVPPPKRIVNTPGIISHPQHFDISVAPRSPASKAVLNDSIRNTV
ncbi:cytochrome P450 [Rickenella mellea]|uniref:Cytochrome P450 n=1 Tax=Rickenella mellea TaxID=50990 RepID=A0A4R5XDH7_9AGAM|nr:cytochrome P450 [Rickenella mellea]